jgi:hypothetical protein
LLRRANIVRYSGDNRATLILKPWLYGGMQKKSGLAAKRSTMSPG